jgi:hypothetical protein
MLRGKTMYGLLAGVAIVWLMPDGMIGQEPTEDDRRELAARVERLIGDLDNDQRTVRVRAERDLLSLGPDVLPLLPAPELLRAPAAESAVRRIRIGLERQKANDSALASRVTMRGTLPLEELLREMTVQTGNRFDVSELPDDVRRNEIAIDCDDQPFWSCLDSVARKANFGYRFDTRTEALLLESAPEDRRVEELAVSYAGAYRLEVQSAEVRPVFNDDEQQILRFRLGLLSEPRLRPLFLGYAGEDMQAWSGDGTALPPFSPDARPEIPLGERGRRLDVRLDFRAPSGVDVSSARLRGKFVMHTAAGTEEFVFNNLPRAENVSRRQGGVTVTLQEAQFRPVADDEHRAHVQLTVAYDAGGPAFESHRTWIFHNEVFLETEEGRRLDFTAYEVTQQADGVVGVAYRFDKLQEAPGTYRLVYRAPTLIVDVPLEFEFAKIPISDPQRKRQP